MNGGTTVIAEPLTPLGRDRKVFTENGKPWRYKGVTAFPLIDHFWRSENIDPFLDAFAGYNTLRCFDYVPSPPWATPWNPAPIPVVREFLRDVGDRGWRVELVILTDDDPARVAPAQARIAALAREPNLMIEAGNEPPVNQIDTSTLRQSLERAGILHCSGDSGEGPAWYGTYLTAHTDRGTSSGHAKRTTSSSTTTVADRAPRAIRRVACRAWPTNRSGQIRRRPTALTSSRTSAPTSARAPCSARRDIPRREPQVWRTPQRIGKALRGGVARRAERISAGCSVWRVSPNQRQHVADLCRRQSRGPRSTDDAELSEPGWTAIDADGILWRL
jgi:hypothetical protein